MNKITRCVVVSLTCLMGSHAHAITPLSHILLRGTKAAGIGLAYAITSPFIAMDYLTGRQQDYEEEQAAHRPTHENQPHQNSHMVIENVPAQLGNGPAIVVTVNNNNQVSSTQPETITIADRPSLYDSVSKKAKQTVAWIRTNKLACITLITIGTYGSLQGYLWYLARYLSHVSRWSLWKQHCSLEDLYQAGHETLIKDLVEESGGRSNTANPIVALERFATEAGKELVLLARYKKLAHSTQIRFLKKIFFVSHNLLETIDNRIQRLTYLKSLADGWLSEQQEASLL